jgi:hypothetical protein
MSAETEAMKSQTRSLRAWQRVGKGAGGLKALCIVREICLLALELLRPEVRATMRRSCGCEGASRARADDGARRGKVCVFEWNRAR